MRRRFGRTACLHEEGAVTVVHHQFVCRIVERTRKASLSLNSVRMTSACEAKPGTRSESPVLPRRTAIRDDGLSLAMAAGQSAWSDRANRRSIDLKTCVSRRRTNSLGMDPPSLMLSAPCLVCSFRLEAIAPESIREASAFQAQLSEDMAVCHSSPTTPGPFAGQDRRELQ
jgi:hypothetical protein